MREVSIERAWAADPARGLPRLEQALARQGYQAAARSSHEFSFLGEAAGGKHRLTVRADGRTARFTFAPGSPLTALPEHAELERRVDGALAALGDAPAPTSPASATTPDPVATRCQICATPLSPGDRSCPTCGMPR